MDVHCLVQSKLTSFLTHSYFYYPNYEIAAAEYTEKKKQAFSIAEFLTFAGTSYSSYDTSGFTGSALVSDISHKSPFVSEEKLTLAEGHHCGDGLYCVRWLLPRHIRRTSRYLLPQRKDIRQASCARDEPQHQLPQKRPADLCRDP